MGVVRAEILTLPGEIDARIQHKKEIAADFEDELDISVNIESAQSEDENTETNEDLDESEDDPEGEKDEDEDDEATEDESAEDSHLNTFELKDGKWIGAYTDDEGNVFEIELLAHDPELLEQVLVLEVGESFEKREDGFDQEGNPVTFIATYTRTEKGIEVRHDAVPRELTPEEEDEINGSYEFDSVELDAEPIEWQPPDSLSLTAPEPENDADADQAPEAPPPSPLPVPTPAPQPSPFAAPHNMPQTQPTSPNVAEFSPQPPIPVSSDHEPAPFEDPIFTPLAPKPALKTREQIDGVGSNTPVPPPRPKPLPTTAPPAKKPEAMRPINHLAQTPPMEHAPENSPDKIPSPAPPQIPVWPRPVKQQEREPHFWPAEDTTTSALSEAKSETLDTHTPEFTPEAPARHPQKPTKNNEPKTPPEGKPEPKPPANPIIPAPETPGHPAKPQKETSPEKPLVSPPTRMEIPARHQDVPHWSRQILRPNETVSFRPYTNDQRHASNPEPTAQNHQEEIEAGAVSPAKKDQISLSSNATEAASPAADFPPLAEAPAFEPAERVKPNQAQANQTAVIKQSHKTQPDLAFFADAQSSAPAESFNTQDFSPSQKRLSNEMPNEMPAQPPHTIYNPQTTGTIAEADEDGINIDIGPLTSTSRRRAARTNSYIRTSTV